jgi:hypothetical protein
MCLGHGNHAGVEPEVNDMVLLSQEEASGLHGATALLAVLPKRGDSCGAQDPTGHGCPTVVATGYMRTARHGQCT